MQMSISSWALRDMVSSHLIQILIELKQSQNTEFASTSVSHGDQMLTKK